MKFSEIINNERTRRELNISEFSRLIDYTPAIVRRRLIENDFSKEEKRDISIRFLRINPKQVDKFLVSIHTKK